MKRRLLEKITQEEFAQSLQGSASIREVIDKLGYTDMKTSYRNMKFLSEKFSLPLPVWENRRSGEMLRDSNIIPNELFFAKGTNRGGPSLKRRMLILGIPNACSMTGCPLSEVNATWCGEPISLQVDHTDGSHTNNELSNLRLLCPNCHSQTSTYAGRARKREQCGCGRKKSPGTEGCPHYDETVPLKYRSGIHAKCFDCKKQVAKGSMRCPECANAFIIASGCRRRNSYPEIEEIDKGIQEMGFLKYANTLGISDNGLRKYLLSQGVTSMPAKLTVEEKAALAKQENATTEDSVKKEHVPGKCIGCNADIQPTSLRCNSCSNIEKTKQRRAKTYPPVDELIVYIENSGYESSAKSSGISVGAIRRYLLDEGINPLPRKLTKVERARRMKEQATTEA